jgi:WD40 repeat protein
VASLKHSGPVYFARLTGENTRLLTASEHEHGDEVILWNVKDQQPLTRMTTIHGARPTVLPDSGLVAGMLGNDVVVWRIADDGMRIEKYRIHRGDNPSKSVGGAVSLRPGGKALAYVAGDGRLVMKELGSNNKAVAFDETCGRVFSLQFSWDGNLLAAGCNDGKVRVWDVAQRKLLATCGHIDHVNATVFSPDGKVLATGSEDTTAKTWSLKLSR